MYYVDSRGTRGNKEILVSAKLFAPRCERETGWFGDTALCSRRQHVLVSATHMCGTHRARRRVSMKGVEYIAFVSGKLASRQHQGAMRLIEDSIIAAPNTPTDYNYYA